MNGKNKLFRIGIAGCGAIGGSLAGSVIADFSATAELSGLYDIDNEKARALSDKLKKRIVVNSLDELINNSDLIIEATKASSSFEISRKAVMASCDVMVMSVGGIAGNLDELESLARENNAQVFIPSGAVSGIDGLKASAGVKIRKVTLTTRKPPKAFSGVSYLIEKNIRLDGIAQDTVIFEGSASLAIKAFPQNINVAATLSLAGIGPDNTVVRIIASPGISRNIHEIEIESDAGRIFTATENLIHPENPKTSYLAVLSAVATLRQILRPVKIGT